MTKNDAQMEATLSSKNMALEQSPFSDELSSAFPPSFGTLMKESLSAIGGIKGINDAVTFAGIMKSADVAAIEGLKDFSPAILGFNELRNAAAFGVHEKVGSTDAAGGVADRRIHEGVEKLYGLGAATDANNFQALTSAIGAIDTKILSGLGGISAATAVNSLHGFEAFIKPVGLFDSIGLLKPFVLDGFDPDDYSVENDIQCVEEFGFDFIGLWLLYPVIQGIHKKPSKQRNAILTNTLRNYTSNVKFI